MVEGKRKGFPLRMEKQRGVNASLFHRKGYPFAFPGSFLPAELLPGDPVMLRLRQPQLSLWDTVVPAEVTQLDEELKRIDQLLDDEAFMAPFRAKFSARRGRPTIPIETFLCLMYLKFRYELGYETLVKEVQDSLKWRRFCRLRLDERVPHSTTLIKMRRLVGSDVVDRLNRALVRRAREQKLIRGRKLRLDTTAVEADIHYPTDASLLADSVRVVTRWVRKAKKAGLAVRTRFRMRTRAMKRRLLQIAKVLRRRTEEAHAEVRPITRGMMAVTQAAVAEAEQVWRRASQTMRRRPASASPTRHRILERLKDALAVTRRVIQQTEQVEAGERHIPDRLVSLFDRKARPIRRGKLRAPTEFGRKVLLQETEEGVVTGYRVLEGSPADETLLVAAVEDHVAVFGKAPPVAITNTSRGSAGCNAGERVAKRGSACSSANMG